ncbi:MAG TPA: hypothetical protein VF192_00940 [Longimicrobiales bacterium]
MTHAERHEEYVKGCRECFLEVRDMILMQIGQDWPGTDIEAGAPEGDDLLSAGAVVYLAGRFVIALRMTEQADGRDFDVAWTEDPALVRDAMLEEAEAALNAVFDHLGADHRRTGEARAVFHRIDDWRRIEGKDYRP